MRIYGAPWHSLAGYSFFRERGEEILAKWLLIEPDSVDVLLTHSPPLGHSDANFHGVHFGCAELLNCVERRIRPRYHVFGHCHEGWGVTTNDVTTFINAANCNVDVAMANEPILFDVPLKAGLRKNPTTAVERS